MKKPEIKNCQNCKKDFQIESEDFVFYEKMKVPAPTWCPECRLQRRFAFWNQKNVYKRKCDATGEMMFSSISDTYQGKVYEQKYWWSDKWDAIDYGRDYDFSKTFFEQVKELSLEVPRFSRAVLNFVNSDYCAFASDLKNCYLIFDADRVENSSYGVYILDVKDSIDNSNLFQSELCYGCFEVKKSYKVFYSANCNDCQEVYFSKNLSNCQNCFGCVDLKNKSYYIFNKQYSKDEYQKKIKEFDLGSYANVEKFKNKIEEAKLSFPNRFMHGIKNLNVSGDYIVNSKNSKNSFFMDKCEDCKYCFSVYDSKDCQDYTSWGNGAELIYEGIVVGNKTANIKFCYESFRNSSDLEYCISCVSSSNLFGCVGLNKKQYCILNKQYSKEEYFEMVKKIKEKMKADGEYGEFFPVELSPFAYNETIAQEYFPLTKEEAIKKGYKWKEREERNYQIDIKPEDLPDNIKDVDNDILKKVIGCSTKKENQELTNCTEAFKIIPSELEFYKKMNLPLPRYCPNCRHHHRLKNRNPLKLYKRTCMKEGCNNEFETTYAPDRPEIVYCEKCYQEEVV